MRKTLIVLFLPLFAQSARAATPELSSLWKSRAAARITEGPPQCPLERECASPSSLLAAHITDGPLHCRRERDCRPSRPLLVPLSPGATQLIEEAVSRSATVAAQLRRLDATDLVIYLTDLSPSRPNAPASCLSFLSHEAGGRYLLIRIDRFRVSTHERVALLGHELEHALEVAAAPEVKDPSGLASLYKRIGWEPVSNQFETKAAQSAGNRVRDELFRSYDRKRP